MASLWPEHDADSARKLLNQCVYVLRKTLGEGAIASELDELRLDSSFLRVDVVEFQSAIERGSPAEAVELYRAPFLDGFFLTGTPEFAEWCARERSRLGGLYATALEELAEEAEAAGDHAAAIGRWKARVVHDPYDTPATLRLMAALDAAGQRAAALRHARTHEQLLREDLGVGPPAELRALEDRLRAEPLPAPPDVAETNRPAAGDAASETAPAAPLPFRPTAAAPRMVRRHLRIAAAMVLLGAMVSGVLLVRAHGGDAATIPSVAVLPLENLGDPADASLAAGMTDEIVTRLAQLQGLRVMGRSAVRPLLERGVDARDVAGRLGVDHVLEGGVQKAGDRLRVRLRLIDVRDGTTRWSHTYDGVTQDVFALHDEIAFNVANELGVRIGSVPARTRPGTRNLAAYEHYLKGSDHTLLRSDSGAWAGLEHFQRAVAEDSVYAAAWAGLAKMTGRVTTSLPASERRHYFELGRQAAERAVALDDSLAEAHATLGLYLMNSLELSAAERHLKRAVALDPRQARTHEWLVALHLWAERPERALSHARQALELEPLSPIAHAELARALAANGRCTEALDQLKKLETLRPPLLRAAGIAALCHAQLQQWDTAVALARRGSAGPADPLLGFYLARAGMTAEAEEIRQIIVDQWRRGEGDAFSVALQFIGADAMDESFLWLNRALEDGSLNGLTILSSNFMLFGPLFAQLQRDPRFAELRRRIQQDR